jgi:hypothetical protein
MKISGLSEINVAGRSLDVKFFPSSANILITFVLFYIKGQPYKLIDKFAVGVLYKFIDTAAVKCTIAFNLGVP